MELSKRWRWLGVEFVVIALGVLTALFVETWLQDQENVERAEVYRQRLIADIQQDMINLEAVIADLATLDQAFIIVHGANLLRDQLAQQLGMEKTVLL